MSELQDKGKLYPAKKHLSKVFDALPKYSAVNPQDAVIYLEGEETRQRHTTDRDIAWRQESHFFYLSGLEVPGSKLLATYSELILFVPPIDNDAVIWMGLPIPIEQIKSTHNCDKVLTTDELPKYLEKLSTSTSILLTLPGVKSPSSSLKTDDTFLYKAMEFARIVKTPEEIELLALANKVTSEAHVEVMKGIGRGLFTTEYEIAAYFQYKCAFKGSKALGYESIVAWGPSSATLHYVDNKQRFELEHSQLLLMDAGCEMSNYSADITRTFPVGNKGRFSEKGKLIYRLVQRMQQAAFKEIRAGASWVNIHLLTHRIAVEGLIEMGVLIAGPSKNRGAALVDELYEKNLSVPFYPHGLGHNLGLDVHDAPISGRPDGPSKDPKAQYLRIGLDLMENQVVTVEPGIYFNPFQLAPYKDSPHINHELVKEYVKVGGVRLEDDVVVTKEGYRQLTTAPKLIEEIEALTASD